MTPILPPATLGVLGGGQLGRFFVLAARRLGYGTAVLDPDAEAPAHALADHRLIAPLDDAAALDRLGALCAAVTVEREGVPASSLRRLAARCTVAPGAEALAIGQDRLREKRFLRAIGLPTAPWREVLAPADAAPAALFPALLKTARGGYDGRGQRRLEHPGALPAAWRELGAVPCVLEKQLPLERELSVVLARGRDGRSAAYPVAENRHRAGILHTSIAPAVIPDALAAQAVAAAERIASALDYVGVLAVEFFVTEGALRVNEFAPRPHNSGHFTLDACASSQFEQQARALCGLALGETTLRSPAAMLNVLGEAWAAGEPPWPELMRGRRGALHTYGKRQAKPGRKMAHVTLLAPSAPAALAEAEALHARLAAPCQGTPRSVHARGRTALAPAAQSAPRKAPVRPIVG